MRTPSALNDAPSAAALTVLCIQDGPNTPCPLAQALEPLGYSLLHATDEPSAHALFARHEPQIVVTALADPAANLRFIGALRATLRSPRVPVLTTLPPGSGLHEMTLAVEAGADECLVCPVDPELLALRMHALRRIAAAQSGLVGVIENVQEGILTIDGRGTVKSINRAACAMFGYERVEVLGHNVKLLMPSPHHEAHDGYLANYLRTRQPKIIGIGRTLEGRRKSGELFPMRLQVTLMAGALTPTFIGLIHDLSDVERQRELEHAALHDHLTGLPNRAHFSTVLAAACATAEAGGPRFAVLFIDLNRFKPINDQHGHGVGDEVLKAVGGRIRNALQRDDTVARLAGDEFVALLPGVADPASAAQVAQRLAHAIEQPICAGPLSLEVGAAIGVAAYGVHGRNAHELLVEADKAMYIDKASAPPRSGD